MAEKPKTDRKIVLEREYVVPLRKEWLKAPYHRRAKKAVKALREFMVKHMKVYDRDLRKIRIDIYLNNEMRFRGMKYPPAKIKVKAIKYDDGLVEVKLVKLPKHIEFELARNVKKQAEILKKQSETGKKGTKEEKVEEAEDKKEPVKPETQEKTSEKEKETSSKEAEQQMDKAKAKEAKHSSGGAKREPEIKRKVMNR